MFTTFLNHQWLFDFQEQWIRLSQVFAFGLWGQPCLGLESLGSAWFQLSIPGFSTVPLFIQFWSLAQGFSHVSVFGPLVQSGFDLHPPGSAWFLLHLGWPYYRGPLYFSPCVQPNFYPLAPKYMWGLVFFPRVQPGFGLQSQWFVWFQPSAPKDSQVFTRPITAWAGDLSGFSFQPPGSAFF